MKPAWSRSSLGLSFGHMAVGLLFVAVAFAAALMPAQNDTFWHLRDGLEIWRTGRIPRVDMYSHTAAGLPYLYHAWLSQLCMYLLFRLGGMPALEIGAAVIVLLTLFTVYRLIVGPPITRFVLLATGVALSSSAWVLRPHIATFLFAVLLLFLLSRGWHLIVPLLFVLWANAHGGVVAGAIILGAATATAAVLWWQRRTDVDRQRLRTLALVLPASLLATAATPLGFDLYPLVAKSTMRGRALQLQEWQATLPTDFLGITFWACAVIFLVTLFVRRRRLTDLANPTAWTDWLLVGAVLVLIPLAAQAVRNVALFALVAVPAMSRLLGPSFQFRLKLSSPSRAAERSRFNLGIMSGAALVAVLTLPMIWKRSEGWLIWRPLSNQAIHAVRSCPGPIYNRYDDGGYLIWFVPEIPVFVDSRQDPYPLRFLLEDMQVEHGQAPWQPLFSRWDIRCAFLPVTSPMIQALASARWVVRYRDERWMVLERS